MAKEQDCRLMIRKTKCGDSDTEMEKRLRLIQCGAPITFYIAQSSCWMILIVNIAAASQSTQNVFRWIRPGIKPAMNFQERLFEPRMSTHTKKILDRLGFHGSRNRRL